MEIVRAFDTSVAKKTQVFGGGKGSEKGNPVGLQGNKAVTLTEKNQGFLGFVELGLDDGRCLVVIRGACQLKIKDSHLAKTGDPIFCNGENSFNLSGGVLIGILKHHQPDCPGFGIVCFKRFDDKELFDLRK